MSRDDNKYDEVANTTGGLVDANTAASVANIGGMAPGPLGVGFETAGAALTTHAEHATTEKDAEFLALRMGLNKEQLMGGSRLLNTEYVDITSGSRFGGRMRKVGMYSAGALPGAMAGAAAGSAILPVGGTFIGGAIGGMGGGMITNAADNMLFAGEEPVNVSETICMACNKQDNGQLSAQDVMQLIALKANPRDRDFIMAQVARTETSGMGLDHVTESYLGPLLDDKYFLNGEMNACQYIADQCNAGHIDIAEMALDEQHMQRRAPAQQQGAGMMAAHDSSFDGNMPSGAPALPSDVRPGGRGSKGGSYSTSA